MKNILTSIILLCAFVVSLSAQKEVVDVVIDPEVRLMADWDFEKK